MTPEEIRIECLKLAHRHDREPAQVVENAKVYEDYISGARLKQDSGRATLGLSNKGRQPEKAG